MDLALSDFFLFGHIKQRTAGQEFASPDKLINLIRGEFDFIPRSVFEIVFNDWPIQLQTGMVTKVPVFPSTHQ
jgi:hypothetical protein